MSTRGCIAYKTKEGFTGVYNHFDSYPGGIGQSIFDAVKKYIAQGKNTKEAIQCVIDADIKAFPQGWSAYPNRSYDLPTIPNLKNNIITQDDPDPLWIDYIYILDPEKESMRILSHRSGMVETNTERIRPCPAIKGPSHSYRRTAWDYGSYVCWYKTIKIVNLNDEKFPCIVERIYKEKKVFKDTERIPKVKK